MPDVKQFVVGKKILIILWDFLQIMIPNIRDRYRVYSCTDNQVNFLAKLYL